MQLSRDERNEALEEPLYAPGTSALRSFARNCARQKREMTYLERNEVPRLFSIAPHIRVREVIARSTKRGLGNGIAIFAFCEEGKHGSIALDERKHPPIRLAPSILSPKPPHSPTQVIEDEPGRCIVFVCKMSVEGLP